MRRVIGPRVTIAAVFLAGMGLLGGLQAWDTASGPGRLAPPAARTLVAVDHVADGDTLTVNGTQRIPGDELDGHSGRETVRIIGVDTPETVDPRLPRDPVTGKRIPQCYGPEASHFTKQLLPPGSTVTLEFDAGTTAAQLRDRTRGHRLLAYVWLSDGRMLNLELVKQGYAKVLSIPPQDDYRHLFTQAMANAKAAHKGRWGACTST